MKRKIIKKLGIIIMSAMITASPVVTPFTTMTVYAEEELVDNDGTIATNVGTIGNNNGTIETNATEGYVKDNNGTIGTNASGAYVINNNETIGTNEGTVTYNNGTIGTSAGNVDTNCDGATIENNYGVVQTNNGTIDNNYGIVETNQGTVENNYTTTVDGTGIVNDGTVTHQWYEVKLVNNTTELRITSNGEIKAKDNNTTTDVFAKKASAITIHSTNPNKIIDALAGGIEYVKNADGSITISNIQNPYSILTTLIDKILPPASPTESEKKEDDNKKKKEVVIEVVAENPILAAPVVAPVIVPTVVAENPVAAIQAAKALQNDPVVVAQAQELAVQMEAVTASYKETAVKELAAAPNQAVVGSAEYEVKQAVIVAELADQIASLNNLTVQSLAVVQKVGVSVATGGCTKLEAANVSLLNEILATGVPITLTYAIDGAPVTIKIPAGVDLTRFIGADGRLDLTKLRAYIVR